MAARFLIEDEEDIYRALKWLALLTVVLAIGMVREQLTLQNMFGLLGGTRLVPDIREDKIRSQAVFQHSLTAGTFAATLLPLFFILWKNGKSKLLAVTGLVGSTVMTICSNSSTPLLSVRRRAVWYRAVANPKEHEGSAAGPGGDLVCLHLVMKAPVWFLIARIDLTGGSSGYHRAELVDQFINHFRDWWLVGTQDAATWGYDLWDQQNQYVSVGETGGLLALWMFIAMIARACAQDWHQPKYGGTRQASRLHVVAWRGALRQHGGFLRCELFRPVEGQLVPASGDDRCCHRTHSPHAGSTAGDFASASSTAASASGGRQPRGRPRSRSVVGKSSSLTSGRKPTYVVITPVRDEEEYLRLTIESMIAQSLLPTEWIIVNDGSKDGTGAIIDEYASRYPWIRAVHRADRGFRKWGAGIMEAFYAGFDALRFRDWDFVSKLDGDLSFRPDYFESALQRFVEIPRLGYRRRRSLS